MARGAYVEDGAALRTSVRLASPIDLPGLVALATSSSSSDGRPCVKMIPTATATALVEAVRVGCPVAGSCPEMSRCQPLSRRRAALGRGCPSLRVPMSRSSITTNPCGP